MTLSVSHEVKLHGSSPLTAEALASFVSELQSQNVPAKARVRVEHSDGQRDSSYTITATW